MAVLYACVYKCSIKMCDFSYYDEGKETNFYIFYRGRWEIYFNFLSIFNSTDGLFDLQNS